MKKLLFLPLLAIMIISCDKQKTAFVNTEKIVQDYQEMNDARDKYTKMSEDIQASLQPKIDSYETKMQMYQQTAQRMSNAERAQKEEEIMTLQNQIRNEQQTKSRRLQEESQTAIDDIVKRVKDYIKEYGAREGYDYIYGQSETSSGVLYGKEEYDVTEKILKELNDKYTPSATSTPAATTPADTTATK